ncbi:MAG: transrane and repeat-containing protein [Bacteroidetes bacterium]|jgi:cytochrome c-type biogenesis protein CcmH/NrfG|nr:transrane and repeat-containing protein [Bacteroidota bacterium]
MRSPKTIYLIVLIIACLIGFSPVLYADFVNYDDPDYVLNNSFLKHFSIKNTVFLLKSSKIDMFIPLTQFSYLLDYSLGGMKAFGFHLCSLLLHILNAILIFFLVRKISGKEPAAFFIALLFAIHPLHVESVAWIAERKDVLYLFFYLLAFGAYIKYRENNKWTWYGLCLLLFICSCFSKPMAITFPLVLVLYDIFALKKTLKTTWFIYLPFVACAFCFVWSTMQQVQHGFENETYVGYSLPEKILLPFYGLCFYLVKCFVPAKLSVIYPYPENPLLLFTIAFVIVAGIGLFIFRNRKKYPLLVAGAVFYVVTLLPVLQIIPNTFSIAADRYFYLSCLGVFVPLVFGLGSRFKSTKNFVFLFSALSVVFCFLCYKRSKVWYNSETLFTDLIKKYPNEFRGYANRGSFYLNEQNYSAALPDLEKAYGLNKKDPLVLNNYGWVLLVTTGDRETAAGFFRESIALDPSNSEAFNNLGSIYGIRKEFDKAFEYIRKAQALAPDEPKINYNLAFTFLQTGSKDSAIFYFEKAVAEGSKEAQKQLEQLR